MLTVLQARLLTVVSLVVMILVITNTVLFSGNRGMQGQINNDQIFIQQSVQLETLYKEMLKALADLSVRNDDRRIKEFLASQGITVTASTPAEPGAKR